MSSSEIAKLLQPATPKKEPATKHSASQIRKVANVNKQTSSWISPFRPTASKSNKSHTKPNSTSNQKSKLLSSPVKVTSSSIPSTPKESKSDPTVPDSPVSVTETPLDQTVSGDGQVVEDEEAIDQTTAQGGLPIDEDVEQTTIEEESIKDSSGLTNGVVAEAIDNKPVIVETPTETPAVLAENKEAEVEKPTTSESKDEETPIEEEATPVEEEEEDDQPVDLSPPEKDAVEQAYASKPKMLNRYRENKKIVNAAMNKNSVENPGRILDLGAGLRLTEAQIYELARKRVAPILKNVDQSVSENLARDKVKADAEESKIVQKDEKKMGKLLTKYKARIDKENVGIKSKFDQDMKEIENKMKLSEKATEKHIADVKAGISKDIEDGDLNEENAAAAHITNKETTIKNAEEFKELKIVSLKETVDQQAVEKEKTEKLQTDGAAFEKEADELSSKLSEKELELQEKLKKLEELLATKSEKDTLIRSAIKQKKISERNLIIINQKYERASANHTKLQDHFALLTSTIGAHSTKINDLQTSGKEALVSKRAANTKAAADWDEEVQQMRIEEARKQEKLKIEAEEERKRIEEEKAAEELRLKEEKAAEELRLKEEQAAEELRLKEEKAAEEEKARLAKIAEEEKLAKEKEENLKLAELKRKEQLEESKRLEEEVKEMEKLKTLKSEKARLSKELAAFAAGSVAAAAGTAAVVGSVGSSTANAAGSTVSGVSKVVSSSLPNAPTGVSSPKAPTEFPTSKGDISEPIHEQPEEHLTTSQEKSTTVEDRATPSKPLQRRRSMVDDALRYLSPEEQAKMNKPLSEQLREKKANESRNNSLTGKNPIASGSRTNSLTRSNSFAKKFKPRSRSNSIKSRATPITSPAKPKSESKTITVKAVSATPAAATATIAAAVDAAALEDKIEKPDAKEIKSTSTVSPSNASAPKTEKKVSKPAETSIVGKSPSSTELLEPEHIAITDGSKPESGDDLDSLEAKKAISAKPVFTEEVVAATTDKSNIESEYEEVVSLVTVDSTEYHANKGNPDYIVIEN